MKLTPSVKVLQICTSDKAGGAEKVAYELFKSQRKQGYDSYLAVGKKLLNDDGIVEIPNNMQRNFWAGYWREKQEVWLTSQSPNRSRIAGWLANLGEINRWWEWQQGIEDFHFPATNYLLNLPPDCPDIIHAHNLHGGYFDLRRLVELSNRLPVILTLHDEWLFTGHCSYTLGCERWETGCGNCPDLTIYPAILFDSTSANWQRKRDIYAASQLYISSPSHWLLDRAKHSILKQGIVESKVIPYGVDLSVFSPFNLQKARHSLGLPVEAGIVLFVANKALSNPFKDYATIEQVQQKIASQIGGQEIIFLCVGEEKETQQIGNVSIRFTGHQHDAMEIAKFYQAANVFVHAAHADNFPNTILESLACGTPVVATAIGGIPEQIEEGGTGFLVPPRDSQSMSERVVLLLTDKSLHRRMSGAAAEAAKQRFDLVRQVDEYLNWYIEILRSRKILGNLH